MKSRSPLRVVGVALCCLLLVAACSSDAPISTAAPDTEREPIPLEEMRLGLAVQSLDRTFFTGMEAGASAQADTRGVTLTVIDGRDDHASQMHDVEALLDRIDALLLSPVDSALSTEIVELARASGVPVIAVANQVGSVEEHGPQFVHPHTVALVTNDDVSMGRKAGAFVALQGLSEPVAIAVLSGARGTANVAMRLDGFEQELNALGIGYEIVADVDGSWTAEGGHEACVEFASASADLIFSMSDAMTAGCADALSELGLELPIVSIGGNAAGIELLVQGRIVGSVCQKPGDMGALAVDVAIDSLSAASTMQGLQFYDTPLVTPDTLDECAPQW